MLSWFGKRRPSSPVSGASGDAEACKNQGNALLAEGNLDAAADCYRRALSADPDYAEAHNNLGFVLFQQQRFDEAAQHLEAAIRLKPVLANAHFNLGKLRQVQGDHDGAIAGYREALALEPGLAEASLRLASLLQAEGRSDEAIACLRQAAALQPDVADLHHHIGLMLLQRRQFAEAAEAFGAALAGHPSVQDCVLLGVALAESGQRGRAVAAFEQAVALDPRSAEAHYCLGNALHAEGEGEAARASFEKAIALDPGRGDAHNNLGILLKEQGRLADALVHMQAATVLSPQSAEFRNNLGLVLFDLNRMDEAVASYRGAIALQPGHADAHYHLCLALQKLERLDEAIASNQTAIALKPDFGQAHINLANLLQKKGRLDEALASVEQAVALEPTSAGAYNNLGLVLQDRGELEAAEAAYRKSLELEPSAEQRANYNLGLVLLSSGRLPEGWKYYSTRFIRHEGSPKREFPYVEWDGQPLAGKRLLIWGEQGIGDEILFASMFHEAIAAAGHCVIECAPKLEPLFARSFPGAEVVARGDPPQPATQQGFDYQSAAGGLARWLRPGVESFPRHAGFLVPAPSRLAHWRTRLAELGPGLKVGICWRSGLRTGARLLHYTGLDQWGAIFGVPGVHFVNLQYDRCEDELAGARTRFGVGLHAFPDVDLFNDLDEAAALTRALDVVISAPTAASALAAALGVPTWQMTYGGSLWVTMGTDGVPWFPDEKLFMRRWDRPWDDVIGEVAADLRRRAGRQ